MRKIAFIGVGNMANAIIGGLLRSGAVDCPHLILSDKLPEKCTPYTEKGAVLAPSPAEAAAAADCVVLAVKPQSFPEVLDELSAVAGIQNKLIVTIAAGITAESVRTALRGAPVVRVLPNTPMLIGMGVSVICRAPDVDPADFAFVSAMFEASGSVTVIDEAEMNRIISVTSSSPAYVFAFIDAICRGATAQGLDGDALLPAVCDMVIGSATLLRDGGLTPAEQISRVTSKGGTTERAMSVLYEADLTGTVETAMKACTKRADELATRN
jgi:pyrroline-5-carboxylate reductase